MVLVKDKAEKPFALAFLPLIEKAGTVIQDGHRHLVVYKVRSLPISSNRIDIALDHTTKIRQQSLGLYQFTSGTNQCSDQFE